MRLVRYSFPDHGWVVTDFEGILGALDVVLTPEEVKFLEEAYVPQTIKAHA
jgi:hypothetical protein